MNLQGFEKTWTGFERISKGLKGVERKCDDLNGLEMV